MPKVLSILAILCFLAIPARQAHAQLADSGMGPVSFGAFGDEPVEITADGETRFEGGVAIAEDNVQVHYGGVSIYCDYAEYNPDTRDVLLVGNVRIYSPEGLFAGQRAVYNLESKQTRALEFAGEFFPLRFRAMSLRAPSMREFRVSGAMLTTDDSSEPDFHVRARTMRIYPDDRVIFVNSTLYVRNVPVFWFPYLYSNLSTTGFTLLPGFDSRWGAFLLTSYAFPIGQGNDIVGRVRADYRTQRGFALGFDADINFGPDDRNTGTLETYHAWDQDPGERITPGEPPEKGDTNRYRVAYKQTLFLTDDIYAKADINVLSDQDFLEDFFPGLFRIDPEPDTHISLTKWADFYTLNLLTRFQVNDFQQTTERLPEFAIDIKNHRIFGWPVFYAGSTSAGALRRLFADGSTFPDYDSFRFDTFHELSLPTKLFGWWSVIPRAGFRLTYYNKSGTFLSPSDPTPEDPASLDQAVAVQSSPLNTPTNNLDAGGPILRPIFNFNVENSFKLSKAYERIQARWLGLDGVRHVIQPYTNLSVVVNAGASPEEVLQFDRVVPSTDLLPINFPDFTGIDSLDTWAIFRTGVRQRLQTRRNNETFEWMSLDTYFDANMENPYSNSPVSNLFNLFRFNPVPWVGLSVLSQLPLDADGFTEIDTRLSFMPIPELAFGIGHAYINGNEFFEDSSQLNFSAYWRINDNWAVSLFEQYEAEENVLMYQRYMIHRDLSSWIASFGTQIRDNQGGDTDIGILFVMTLKDAPQVSLPLAFDTGTTPLGPGSANN